MADDGIVSVMTLNAKTMAVRPALERRWSDALAAFDTTAERGVLDVDTRADSVDDLAKLLRAKEVEPLAWYGVLLLTDWMDLATTEDVSAVAAVELQASRRDPYRQLSRTFHLVGRRIRSA